MLGNEGMELVATYKRYDRSTVTGKWQVSSLKCYRNAYYYTVVVKIYGSKHAWSKTFSDSNKANQFVKQYTANGFKKVYE